MSLTLGIACANTPTPIQIGDFPPCPSATKEEIHAMGHLGKSEETKPVSVLLGRIIHWCKAYHARIGYEINVSE